MSIREVQVHPSFRIAELASYRADKDEDGNEIHFLELSFSSEYPVERYDWWDDSTYLEVLDHGRGSVRLDRLNDGAPFLVDHMRSRQPGVIQKASIVDRRGLATVRLSVNARNFPDYGDLVADFRDGVRPKVSVAYRVYKAVLEEKQEDGPDTYRITDWEPFEISSVSIPADPSVGIDRSMEERRGEYKPNTLQIDDRNLSTMNDKVKTGSAPEQQRSEAMTAEEMSAAIAKGIQDAGIAASREASVNVSEQVRQQQVQLDDDDPDDRTSPAVPGNPDEIRRNERQRLAQIDNAVRMVRRVPGVDAAAVERLAQEYRDSGKDPADLFRGAMEKFAGAQGLEVQGGPQPIGMTDTEVERFSFMRCISLMTKVQLGQAGQRDYQDASFEIRVCQDAQEAYGKQARGFLIPDDVLHARILPLDIVAPKLKNSLRLVHAMQQRDITIGGTTSASQLLATDLDAASFIELLRARMVLVGLGARIVDGLVGNLAIPKQTGGATVYWVAESGTITESQPTFGQVTMSPKTAGALVDISRRALIQSTPAVEAIVISDINAGMARDIDRVGIAGNPDVTASANEPRGILYQSGIGSVSSAGLTRTLLVNLEKEVAVDNADFGSLAYLTNPLVRASLKLAKVDTGSGQFVWPPGANELEGYPVATTTQVPSTLGGSSNKSAAIFGNFDDLLLGFWTGLDLMVDPYTLSNQGAIRVTAFQDCDVAVRHAESFAAATDLAA